MRRKKWWLIITLVVFAAACFFLFFKTYSEKNVAENADHIISIDTKRITNTAIWTYITTPSLWKPGKIFASKKEVDWKDMVKIPDYVFVFHVAGQPGNAWYTVLEVKDEDDFKEGITSYGFVSAAEPQSFVSTKYGLTFVKYKNKLLVGNARVEDRNLITETAKKLFEDGKYIQREKLKKNIEIPDHIAWTFSGDNILQSVTGSAGFDKAYVHSVVNITLNEPANFPQRIFSKAVNAPANLGFTRPPVFLYNLITDSAKQKASRLVNFNIDSLFLPTNNHYQLVIGSLVNKIDTAISYSYDADFNPIEKKVVNNILEPSFDFEVYGNNASSIYNYWSNNGIIEKTSAGDLFTPMPFVKSYCSIKENAQLIVRSNNWTEAPKEVLTDSCFLSASINTLALPDSLIKYLPTSITPIVKKIASINVIAKKAGNSGIKLEVVIDKRRDVEWFD